EGDIDFVAGFGKFNNLAYDPSASTKMTALSWVVGFHYTFVDGLLTIGARFPFTHANLESPTGGKTNTNAVGTLALDGKMNVEIQFKTGGNPSPVESELHNPSINSVTTLSGLYEFFDAKLSPGLRAWLAVAKPPVSKGTRDFSGAQFVIEPSVATRVPLNQSK